MWILLNVHINKFVTIVSLNIILRFDGYHQYKITKVTFVCWADLVIVVFPLIFFSVERNIAVMNLQNQQQHQQRQQQFFEL